MRAAITQAGTARFVSICNIYHLTYCRRVAINMLLIANCILNCILMMTSGLQFAVNMLLIVDDKLTTQVVVKLLSQIISL